MIGMKELLGPDSLNPPVFENNIDVVFVIDATESMNPIIDQLKEAALLLYDRLMDKYIAEQNRTLNFRIKVTWFRDFYFDGDNAYGETEFFKLPEQVEKFHEALNNICCAGGGDIPESGLEALTMAMRSDFVQTGFRKRHIIVLFTDAPAHPLEDYDRLAEWASKMDCKTTMYPENMPKDICDFCEEWDRKSIPSMRLLLFAPHDYPWSDIDNYMRNVLHIPIAPGEGVKDMDLEDVMQLIVCGC